RFTTGSTLACWMKGTGGRLEFIQIPEPKPAPDAFRDEHYVGYYHLSFDLTAEISAGQTLNHWLEAFREKLRRHELSTEVLLFPHLQVIGEQRYEVAFVTDMDGLPLEFLRRYSSRI
ncbi:MAG: VOC family protein, partial [Cyanobacteria bacterium P01_F01_bin.42]